MRDLKLSLKEVRKANRTLEKENKRLVHDNKYMREQLVELDVSKC